jgi:hypothetical protein
VLRHFYFYSLLFALPCCPLPVVVSESRQDALTQSFTRPGASELRAYDGSATPIPARQT